MPNQMLDLTGQTFGRWTVLCFARREQYASGSTKVYWIARCTCGSERDVLAASLRSGASRSCGCEANERLAARLVTHGQSRSPEYRTWGGMVQRCTNPRGTEWANYGGRGIEVCAEWRESFEAFLAHVGPKPTPSHSIDRIDVNGNYEPGNVRWATQPEQNANRRPQARASHCKRGHELTADNVYESQGKRTCRQCNLNWHRRTRERATA